MILNPDSKLKRQVLSAFAQISKHSVELAELVVEAEIFPAVLTCLKVCSTVGAEFYPYFRTAMKLLSRTRQP